MNANMKNQDRLAGLQAFLETAKRGTFVAAASALDINVSSVSRRISELERRLGVQLMQRTTRSISLTQAGREYYQRGAELLAQLDQLDASVESVHRQPRGLLKLALPNGFGRDVVLPALPEFLKRHPDIDVDLHFSDAFVDIVGLGFDLAVRIGELKESGLVARKLAVYRRFLCASPAYLKAAGVPRKPDDLSAHRCLNFSPIAASASWQLIGSGGAVTVEVDCRLRANDVHACHVAAVHGLGIAVTADFVAAKAIGEGKLVQVLPRWKFADAQIYAVYPSARHVPARVRAFHEHLAATIGGVSGATARKSPK
jgi:DNA-binding transcriptional LysR family regulator